jgi:trimethylamine--corrinoid protein Co-methyltransferase
MLESLLCVAYENYVIDDDIGGQVMRLVRGLEVTDDTLSLDVIHEICTDGPGHYLGHAQTIQLMNTEYHFPHTADRNTRQTWEEAGSLDMRERARRKARELLRSHCPEIVSAETDQRLRARFNVLLPREVMRRGGYH